MTVKELIEKLKEFPQDMRVQTYDWLDIDNVEIKTWQDSNWPYDQPDEDRVIIE